jgi:hypothetical protein
MATGSTLINSKFTNTLWQTIPKPTKHIGRIHHRVYFFLTLFFVVYSILQLTLSRHIYKKFVLGNFGLVRSHLDHLLRIFIEYL